jgi:hypothetical protein
MERLMPRVPLASIIISSYNYACFLREAIDSALAQTYPETEVLVVDDGSTDSSWEIIQGYGDRVRGLRKENGGQASAFNAGLREYRGDVVFFMDSDDALLPSAVNRAMTLFRETGVAKVHWPLEVVDEHGRKTGEVLPEHPLPEGNLRRVTLQAGADGYTWPPTTGNCWSRAFLEAAAPLPEEAYRTCPDFYLATLAPLYGLVRQVAEPLGLFRIHGGNHGWLAPVEERLEALRQRTDHALASLARHCRVLGLPFDPAACRENSWSVWLERVYEATCELAAVIPADTPYILADEGKWETRDLALPGRRIPFPEERGQYPGNPPDDETAVREFERLRRRAGFMAFGWPAFWYLDYYAGFGRHLRSHFDCVLDNERLIVFDLRQRRGSWAYAV